MNPHILQQMKNLNNPPEDDGQPPQQENLEGMEPPEPRVTSGLPQLRGSPAQIKWALTIRENALKLSWPPGGHAMLASIDDSTWWIANKAIVTTMKFKQPNENQRSARVGVIGAPSTSVGAALAANSARAQVAQGTVNRFTEAEQWADSVCKHPMIAKAAILACLSKLYKDGEIKERLRRASREALSKADFVIEKDVDAINRMLQ